MSWGAEAWVAIYAAIVASAALMLELRRWWEAGPKITVRALPNMSMLDGAEIEKDLLIVSVANRGDAPTTITHFVIVNYPNAWARFRHLHGNAFIVLNPQPKGTPPIIPKMLMPGEQWVGISRQRTDLMGDIQSGSYWAGIQTTDRNRPYLARIPKRKDRPNFDAATEV